MCRDGSDNEFILICLPASMAPKKEHSVFSVLETKGQHLKGNDDTEYKRKLFELLTSYTDNAIRAGQMELWEETEGVTFTMLLEDTWKDDLIKSGLI